VAEREVKRIKTGGRGAQRQVSDFSLYAMKKRYIAV
jgi:hypothetical protein